MNSERCSQCKHFIIANAGEGKIYGCDRSKCVFEPTTKNDLGVQMTNGEKMQEIFPEGKTRKCRDGVVFESDGWCHAYDSDWWNAEYKEPTTKNDLGVDLISRADALALYCDKCALYNCTSKCASYRAVEKMPSVTPQPCEDTISRVDAINCLAGQIELNPSDVPAVNEYLKGVDKRLHELSSVTPQSRWIPVSEKLPKPFTFVNATCRSLVDDREDWVIETVYLPIPKEANKHGYSDWGNIPMLNWGEAEVIAWVERIIPQPYKADRSEEE